MVAPTARGVHLFRKPNIHLIHFLAKLIFTTLFYKRLNFRFFFTEMLFVWPKIQPSGHHDIEFDDRIEPLLVEKMAF